MTSLVNEYSILYTTRIFQKEKHWQDGILKYYHFNNRIDIHNQDGHIICSDFFPPSRDRERVTSEVLYSGNQFKSPNGSILIDLDEQTGSYERDISSMFQSKRVNVKQELRAGDEQRNMPGGASAGVGAGISKIKYERNAPIIDPDRKPEVHGNYIPVNNNVNNNIIRKRRPIGLARPRNASVSASLLNDVVTTKIETKSETVSEIPKVITRSNLRIPKFSSTHFRYLHKPSSSS